MPKDKQKVNPKNDTRGRQTKKLEENRVDDVSSRKGNRRNK